MRSFDILFRAIALPLDFLMVVAAGLAAMAIRLSAPAERIRPVLFRIPLDEYLAILSGVGLVTVIIFALTGLYQPKRSFGAWGEFGRVVLGCSIVLILIAFSIFLRQQLFDSRFLVLAGYILAILFMTIERAALAFGRKSLAVKLGLQLERLLIIGADSVSSTLRSFFAQEGERAGIRVVKQLAAPEIPELAKAVGNPGVDTVVLADPNYPREKIIDLIDFCNERHLSFKFVPNLFQTLTRNTGFEIFGGVPLVEMKRTRLEGWGLLLKRGLDITGATFGIIISAPLMIAIALAIKIESRGPILYKDRRVGPRGEFNTLKFRTMYFEYCTGSGYPNSEAAERYEEELVRTQNMRKGPVPKVLHDPRRTKAGRFLEGTSLDELPQFFNVFLGHMSFVGPRPHRPKEVAQYAKHHKKVFAVKPGITGLAQITGRSDLDFEDEVKLDTYYVENWSIWMDFLIILKTPLVMFFRRHSS